MRALLQSLFTFWGGGSAPSSSTTVQQNYSPEEAAIRKQLFDSAKGIYDKNKGAYASIVNPAPKPVGPSANTSQGQQMVLNAAQGAGTQVANSAANALNMGLSGDVLKADANPALQGQIDAAKAGVGHSYTDPGGVLSKIRTNFTYGNSGGSGSREGIAGGIAGREYLNTVGNVESSMRSAAYGQGLDYMKSSMAFAPNMYNLMMQPGLSTAAVGAQQEGYQAAQNQYDAAGTSWNLNKDWAALGPYASMVTGMANPSTTSSTQGAAPQGPGAMGVLGGAAMGAYLGSVVPGIGTAVGAGAGALMGLMMS